VGTLVQPQHDPGSAQEVAGAGEDAHVRPDLGADLAWRPDGNGCRGSHAERL